MEAEERRVLAEGMPTASMLSGRELNGTCQPFRPTPVSSKHPRVC
jgi:hypothetical protein